MKSMILVVVFIGAGCLVSTAGPIKEPTFGALSNYYVRILPRMLSKDPSFQGNLNQALTSNKVLDDETNPLRGKVFNVYDIRAPLEVPLNMIVSKGSAKIIQIWNPRIERYIKTNGVQNIPAMSISEALSQAKRYLADLEIVLPTNCVVRKVSFNDNYRSNWEVRWVLTDGGGYLYDEFSPIEDQTIVIVFHEKYGFCGYGSDICFPPPRSTEVKVSKEDALLKASKVASLVMQTPFYRSARASGFKVTGVESAELRIAAPNWLLDPARAIWIREKPPEETRLCWVVRFKTTDTVDRGKMKLTAVEILVYVDAATGEVVGANFT